jgi:ribonuclease VapC
MVIDTSALYAILAGEPERPALIRAIVADPVRLLSAVSLIELLIVVHARMQADGVARLQQFLARARITIVPFGSEQVDAAHAAWVLYGKGRAPASLNLGD